MPWAVALHIGASGGGMNGVKVWTVEILISGFAVLLTDFFFSLATDARLVICSELLEIVLCTAACDSPTSAAIFRPLIPFPYKCMIWVICSCVIGVPFISFSLAVRGIKTIIDGLGFVEIVVLVIDRLERVTQLAAGAHFLHLVADAKCCDDGVELRC